MLTVDTSKLKSFITDAEFANMQTFVDAAAKVLHSKSGAGNDFLGWLDLPADYDKDEFARIKKAADKIKADSEILVVVGIGGSYLGARAAIEMLTDTFYNLNPTKNCPKIIYAGNSISSSYLADVIDLVKDKDFSVNIISKSGTTTEPALAFRILREILINKYGAQGAKKRIYATTDKARGALKTFADAEGYETFVIPDDIGGRFSVLTAVGLLPIACAGIDIDEMMKGAQDAREEYTKPFAENPCYQYVAARNILRCKGKTVELMVNYEPCLTYFSEWWKQLFGESEGKDGKGIFPASVNFSTDLHSMGQYIQDGERTLFETNVLVKKAFHTVRIEKDEQNLDGLNFLAGKRVEDVNKMAQLGTRLAHTDGGVPNFEIEIDQIDEYNLGELFYMFEIACGISGYMLGVNPFNQPGVEDYKKNMFALLDKPGYEEASKAIRARL